MLSDHKKNMTLKVRYFRFDEILLLHSENKSFAYKYSIYYRCRHLCATEMLPFNVLDMPPRSFVGPVGEK